MLFWHLDMFGVPLKISSTICHASCVFNFSYNLALDYFFCRYLLLIPPASPSRPYDVLFYFILFCLFYITLCIAGEVFIPELLM